MIKTVAVTGGSGKLGLRLIPELQKHGYNVISLDNRLSSDVPAYQIKVDLNDFGQVIGALQGVDAIIHLAAIPAPRSYTNSYIFANNAASTYHILEAADQLGITNVVIGSSESSYGFAWAPKPFSPQYVPVDENHPQLPQECYGLSKIVNELTGAMFNRKSGMSVTSLRFSMITTAEDYATVDDNHPDAYKHILWSYIDIRDAVNACIAALTCEHGKAVSLNITSSDTLSSWDTQRLLNHYYADVTDLRAPFTGREALVCNRLAQEMLNWQPRYSWMS
ncbi:epimerase [Paenibacillus pectinilyticus]|uniref:Epimerase n=1 Tax=Paenibacillus pectinilyticus TaxID=512399 RepID=A0A1C0ZVT4_9BACL|nr:NAD(P)-dependent oxidoreductase [Paenibacillus pectinilyticus]OCT12221.1 epimerase [Paenibacillus pectinilyticus]